MKTITIDKGQYLTDVYPQIETNTIFCKTLPGLGATYSEIKAKRNSIIVVPNIPAITGKCSKHKADNLFGVKQKVTTNDVTTYLENAIAHKKLIKIIVTPESFYKVKEAFEEVEMNIYVNCFLLLDECHKIVKDVDYRPDITLPMDDFFQFDNKAMVSATPLLPEDSRFNEQKFSVVKVTPNYEYKQPIQLVHTNNVLEAIKEMVPQIQDRQQQRQSICFFINSTDMIHQLIASLKIADQSSVFCSEKSVAKLVSRDFKNAHEEWSPKYHRPFMFFTSRFYNALDIEMAEKPDVVFVSEPYFAEHTMLDPYTDVTQSIGRFRNGVNSVTHVLTTKSTIQQRTKEGLNEYINASEKAYSILSTLYRSSQSEEERKAFSVALETLPYSKMIIRGEKNHFAIANYIYDEIVKSSYNNFRSVIDRYNHSGYFSIEATYEARFPFGELERFTLSGASGSKKDTRKTIVNILDNLKGDMGTVLFDTFVNELREKDSEMVDIYYALGKEVIEQNDYKISVLRELKLVKEFNDSKNCGIFREALLNTFEVGLKYRRPYVKETLIRLHKEFNVRYPKSVTAETIKEYFKVKDNARIDDKRAILIIEPLI